MPTDRIHVTTPSRFVLLLCALLPFGDWRAFGQESFPPQAEPPPTESTPPATDPAAPATSDPLSEDEAKPAELVVSYGPMPDLALLASDSIARVALQWIRELPDPTIGDYRSSAIMLKLAQRLRPLDEELLRLEIQAWTAAGDEPRALEATSRLLELAPNDTVAMLRLLTRRIQKLQSAEERLATYDRMLGDRGSSLDPSIRSRLALDAALLARENGDENGFIDRLTLATTLDVTNKDAAALYATYFLDQVNTPRERVDLLANVILADPIDASAHTNLANELFRHGAYRGAKRFLERAGEIHASAMVDPTIEDLFDRYLLIWMTEGDQACLDVLQDLTNRSMSQLVQHRKQLELHGIDPGEMVEPLIPSELEILRLAIAFGNYDRVQMSASAARIRDRLDEQLTYLDERKPPYDTVTDEEARMYRRVALLDKAVARLWAGFEVDQAIEDVAALTSPDYPITIDARAEQRLRGLIALRRAEFQSAFALLTIPPGIGSSFLLRETYLAEAEAALLPIADADLIGGMGMAILLEAKGDQRGAALRYARLALENPNKAVGASARRRLETMLGTKLSSTDVVAELDGWALGFAPWLDEMTENPSNFMIVSAKHLKNKIDLFERAMLRVTIKNVSRLPMAIGPEHTFNSRFLLTPRMVVKNGDDISSALQPEAIEFDRRLRLMPSESLSIDVWVSRGPVGFWLERFAGAATNLRWRLIQGYRINAQRRFTPGAISITGQSDLLNRDTIANPGSDAEAIADRFATANDRALLDAAVQSMIVATTRVERQTPEQSKARRGLLIDAIADRLPTLGDFERVFILAMAYRAGMYGDSTRILDAVRDDSSPFVQAILMSCAHADPDDPALVRLTEDPDAEIRELALLTRERLQLWKETEAAQGN